MKIAGSWQISAALFLSTGLVRGAIQAYSYSGQIGAYTEADLSEGGGSVGGAIVNFGLLNETIYYDSAAQTLRQVGSITITPSSVTFGIYPPWNYWEPDGSATLTVGDGNSVSFDHTDKNLGNQFLGDLLIPVHGEGIYKGQQFAGTWNLNLMLVTEINAVDAESLTFSQVPITRAQAGETVISTSMGNLTDGTQDGTYYYDWEINSGVASVIPEPSAYRLGLCCLALGLMRRAWARRGSRRTK